MIKPFKYYLKENLVRKSIPNISMARSLIEKANLRLKRLTSLEIKEDESSFIFEEAYECIRESLQSLMEVSGYKPYSHEALISFCKEKNLLSDLELNDIDNYRILRNNSVYRAEKISLQKCIESIDFAKKALPKIKEKFEMLIK